MKTKTTLEASRNSLISRLRPCPHDLAKILKVLDLIPRSMRLPDLQKRIARFAAKRPGITAVERYVHVHELLSESLKGTPDEFQQLVWEGDKAKVSDSFKMVTRKFFVKGSPETSRQRILDELLEGDDDVLDDIYFGTIDDAVREYTFIRESHDKLQKIIGMAERRNSWLRLVYPLETSGTITVNKDGVVEISHDRFAAAVAGVDATLIRECQNCQRIFWAGRKDKNSCSPACAHVLRNRRYRERYKEGFYQGAKLTAKEKSRVGQKRQSVLRDARKANLERSEKR
jgi:hypothetical protein